jgi:hypothetical protein
VATVPGPPLQEQYSGPLLYLLLLPRKAEKLKVIAALSSHSIENGFVVYTKLCTVPGLISPSSATTLAGLHFAAIPAAHLIQHLHQFFNMIFNNQPVCSLKSCQAGNLPQAVSQDPQSNPGLRSNN